MPASSERRRALMGLVACLALYLALALPQLDLPGLHNDEAVEGALQAEQILSGQPITTFRDAGLSLAGRTWPLMVQDYIGAFNVYLPIPFFALFGPTVATLRVYTVLLGGVTLALAYGFMRSLLGLRAALITGLLLAVSPSFVFWQRQGVFVTSITATLALAMLWAGWTWRHTRRTRWALATGLLAGAGLYAKLLFLWVIGGAVGASVIVGAVAWLSMRRHPLTGLPWRQWTWSLAALMVGVFIGLLPLIQYNAQTGGTFASLGNNLGTSYYGVNNADVANNLRVRVGQVSEVTSGREHLSFLGGSFENALWPWAFGLALAAIGAHAVWTRQAGPRLWLALVFVLAVGQSAFTVSGLFATHFALLAPFWPMVVGAALSLAWERRSRVSAARWLRLGLLVLFAVLWTRDVVVTVSYHERLHRVGGTSGHTDAIYRLVDTLEANPGLPIYAMDWGFGPQVNLLTRGTIVPQEIFGYSWEPDEGFAARLEEALNQPGALYLFHTDSDTVFPRRAAFEAAVAERGGRVETVATLARLDTVPVIEIVRVAP